MTDWPARRIWHAEVRALCDALEAAGAWQTALRVQVAQGDALARNPESSAFIYRQTAEDVAPLTDALTQLRTRGGARRF